MNILSIYSLYKNRAVQFIDRNQVLRLFAIIFACAVSASLPYRVSAQCSVSFTSCPSNFTIVDCDHSGYEPINYPLVIANPSGLCDGFQLTKALGPSIGSLAPLGTYQIGYWATGLDANQNVIASASCLFLVTIVADVQAPVFTFCPPSITIVGTYDAAGNCVAPAYWPTPTFSDNCSGMANVYLNGNYACGSIFPQGSTTVTYTATDPSSNTATCSFTVTVSCPSGNSEPGLALHPIQLTPNPNAGDFNVELFQPAPPGMFFRIIDPTGRLILEKQTETGSKQQQVQTGNLPAGMYFLQVISEGRVTAIEKFAKQ